MFYCGIKGNLAVLLEINISYCSSTEVTFFFLDPPPAFSPYIMCTTPYCNYLHPLASDIISQETDQRGHQLSKRELFISCWLLALLLVQKRWSQLPKLLLACMQGKGSNGNGMHRGKNGSKPILRWIHSAGSQHDAVWEPWGGARWTTVSELTVEATSTIYTRCTDRKHDGRQKQSVSEQGWKKIQHNTYDTPSKHAPDDM